MKTEQNTGFFFTGSYRFPTQLIHVFDLLDRTLGSLKAGGSIFNSDSFNNIAAQPYTLRKYMYFSVHLTFPDMVISH